MYVHMCICIYRYIHTVADIASGTASGLINIGWFFLGFRRMFKHTAAAIARSEPLLGPQDTMKKKKHAAALQEKDRRTHVQHFSKPM